MEDIKCGLQGGVRRDVSVGVIQQLTKLYGERNSLLGKEKSSLVKNLLLALLLISAASFADWGDVYYCQMTNFVDIKLEGEKKNYKLEKFQFKLDQTKKSMIFGGVGYLSDIELKLQHGASTPSYEEPYKSFGFTTGTFTNSLAKGNHKK